MWPFRRASLALLCSLLTPACVAPTDDGGESTAQAASGDEQEVAFRHELPIQGLFDRPFSRAFPIEMERRGVKVTTTVTPSVKLAVSNPILEGKVTIGTRRGLSTILNRPVPKILDAELKASASYSADLTVDLDVRWSTTEKKEIMREIVGDLESKLNGGKALELASNLCETNVPIKDEKGKVRDDIPLKTHYEVVVTCGFEEIDGDLQGVYRAGARGSVVARAVYNSEGVEKRRFRKDPTKKFELDTSDFTIDPQPSFRFTGFRQHVKGSCAVQPVVVVTFENGVGLRLRVDARSSFDTQLRAKAGEGAPQWTLRATPQLSIWGESDIRVPILHTTLDSDTQLFSRTFAEVVVDVGN
jgi:hypothetical protein